MTHRHGNHMPGPGIGLAGIVRQAVGLGRRGGALAGVMAGRGLEPRVREAIMVAVSADNRCRYCSYVHREWARREGLSGDHMAEILVRDYRTTPAEIWQPVEYARELAAADFGPLTPGRQRFYDASLSPEQRRDIEAATRLITLANRVGNTFDALLERTSGSPVPDSSPLDEAVVSGAFLAVAPLMAGVVGVWKGLGPASLVQDFQQFTKDFAEESQTDYTD